MEKAKKLKSIFTSKKAIKQTKNNLKGIKQIRERMTNKYLK